MQKSFNVYTQHPLKTNEDLLFNIIYENKDTLYFLYRKNQLLNMVSEKTTESHVKNALQKVAHTLNFNLIDYTTYADNSITPGRYIFYLEVQNFNAKDGIYMVESKLDIKCASFFIPSFSIVFHEAVFCGQHSANIL
ncbi:GH3 auxin-responsive promoter family protein [Clostridium sp. SM-530-WT-3G]|uniref:GH3 family domain-containing protein n=1 Tax=Clostridium sp. SM-530-WT-3G TaxID=2725303 RepID=UPI00325C1845